MKLRGRSGLPAEPGQGRPGLLLPVLRARPHAVSHGSRPRWEDAKNVMGYHEGNAARRGIPHRSPAVVFVVKLTPRDFIVMT